MQKKVNFIVKRLQPHETGLAIVFEKNGQEYIPIITASKFCSVGDSIEIEYIDGKIAVTLNGSYIDLKPYFNNAKKGNSISPLQQRQAK